MAIIHEVGQNIIDLRKQKGVTQEKLALDAEMSVSYLRSIEHGEANPTLNALHRLSVALSEPFNSVVATRSTDPPTNEEFADALYRLPARVNQVAVFRNGASYPICPRCKNTLAREYQSYCDRCGQCLNWKEYRTAPYLYK